MALREILASFGYDIDHAELSKGEAGINHMVESIGALGRHIGEAFAAYEIKEFVQRTIEGALELKHAAIIAGTTAEKLQSLQFAAEASEVPAEALSMGLMRLQRAMFASGNGAMGAGAAFKALGLDQKDLAKMDSTEAFTAVAQAISGVKNPAEQTALAMKVFGRGGAQLLPILKEGKEGIAKLRDEVVALGGGYSGEYLENSKKYKEETVRLRMAWRSFSVLLTDRLVPAMTWVTDKIMGIIVGINHLSESVDIGRAGLAAFAAAAIVGLGRIIPMVEAFAIKSALPIAGWILLSMAIEDIVTLLSGGTSLSGVLLDKFFGPGSKDAFIANLTAMLTSWNLFKDGIALVEGNGLYKILLICQDIGKTIAEWANFALKLADPIARISFLAHGGTNEDYNKQVKAEHEANKERQRHEFLAGIEGGNKFQSDEFNRLRQAADRARSADAREAQLNQSKPVAGGIELGPGTAQYVPSQVPGYMTSPQYFVDKSSTVVQTMPGTTDRQANAIGAAVAKARRETSEYRGAAYALEDAVE